MPDDPHAAAPGRLDLQPFRAIRYDPAAVPDLAAVTSPPYDVMDRAMIAELLDKHPRNVVRLILPRLVNEPLDVDNPYLAAAARLARWRGRGLLVADRQPALYVYEYGDEQTRVCGVVGALRLHQFADRIVLPHEDVMPEIVADRLAMMEAAEANLEPILLLYDGSRSAGGILSTIRRGVPAMDITAPDGTLHRVWTVADGETVKTLQDTLRPHQALIADGHHRYATYLQLQARRHGLGDGNGPWDYGLAMLIDSSEFPLRLGAIHRSVAELDLATLAEPAGVRLGTIRRSSSSFPDIPAEAHRLLLTDGTTERALELPPDLTDDATDVELLHGRVLPAWSVSEDRIGYHHTVGQTLHRATQDGGVGILLHPTAVPEVMAAARAGRMLPRKSTSFGPKPRMGLLMRAFSDD